MPTTSPDPERPPPRGPLPPGDGRRPGQRPPLRGFGVLLLMLALLWLLFFVDFESMGSKTLKYSEFKDALTAGNVVAVEVSVDRVRGQLKAPTADAEPVRFVAERIEDPELVAQLEKAGVKFEGVRTSAFGDSFLLWLVPLLFLPLVLLLALRARGASATGSALGFGRSRARLVADMNTGVKFEDVAGCDEAKADLQEVVEFLGHPERFVRLGAKIPKGVLLVGPPGTGKTLMARAVAGEAGVPFFSISGSEFVEMFVGVGAARVRDLFEQAKKKAPCIVFVDEIDAIGRARGVHIGPVNDEREQTLNQILVELDGFEPNLGVILLAATNRPDVLDRALLRPGRFDRQVMLDLPDFAGREQILRVHARGKPLADDVDLARVARSTPGFAGADLANALNEAALLAARRGATRIRQQDIEDAIERVIAGPERKTRRLREAERERVAYHESGHAIVARMCEHADPVRKISIVPRGRAALGYTLQIPDEDVAIVTRAELDDKITAILGGRAAEEVIYRDTSTGAANDLEKATNWARQMICVFGMGESAGLMRCAHEGSPNPMVQAPSLQRDCSEITAREIDREVMGILQRCYERAVGILREHSELLEKCARTLLEREVLESEQFEQLVASVGQPSG